MCTVAMMPSTTNIIIRIEWSITEMVNPVDAGTPNNDKNVVIVAS